MITVICIIRFITFRFCKIRWGSFYLKVDLANAIFISSFSYPGRCLSDIDFHLWCEDWNLILFLSAFYLPLHWCLHLFFIVARTGKHNVANGKRYAFYFSTFMIIDEHLNVIGEISSLINWLLLTIELGRWMFRPPFLMRWSFLFIVLISDTIPSCW